jgi:hypothetical protein
MLVKVETSERTDGFYIESVSFLGLQRAGHNISNVRFDDMPSLMEHVGRLIQEDEDGN